MLNRIKLVIRRITCWMLGHIIVLFGSYETKYINGRHFKGDKSGPFAIGWEWVVHDWITCKKLHRNTDVPWPVSPLIGIINPGNIKFSPNDLNNFQGFGNYYQADGEIIIGEGTYIAPNVGIITANHNIKDPQLRMPPQAVKLGEKCWIGMNVVILPGVELGPHTVVGAGAVVTKSFPEGFSVIAGVPAEIVSRIEKN